MNGYALDHTGGDTSEVLRFISCVEGFQTSLLDPTFSDSNIRRSKITMDNRLKLESWNTIVEGPFGEARVFLKCFQVLKKDGLDRLVLDATPLNRNSIPPLNMHLNTIHFIFEHLLKYKVWCTVDAKSYFYQFPVHQSVQSYFAMLISTRRGRALCRYLTRMCMGWRHAPCIAQRTSRTLLSELSRRLAPFHLDFFADVWIDNFIFAAQSNADLDLVFSTFLSVAAAVNLQLHSPSPFSHLDDLLGFSVDLSCGIARHQDKWVRKFESFLSSVRGWTSGSPPTYRDFATLVGNIVWIAFAQRIPLCFFPAVLQCSRCLACQGPSRWDSAALHLGTQVLWDESAHALHIAKSTFAVPSPPPALFSAFSDAATGDNFGEALWAIFDDLSNVSVAGPCPFQHEHIFFMELRCAMHSILSAAYTFPNGHINLGTDNSAALFALRSGHSGNLAADALLRRFYRALPASFSFRALHVPTKINPSDPFTRGVAPDCTMGVDDEAGQTEFLCTRRPSRLCGFALPLAIRHPTSFESFASS